MKISLPILLSFNGGYVDTAGFLALQGLFTAHVTGNFVTFGAAMALGTSGAVAKLLALPAFCIVVVLSRLLAHVLSRRSLPVLRTLLSLKFLLLAGAAVLTLRLGPFVNGNSAQAILTGMVLHRVHLSSAPPSTLMTGTTTQIMIDLADLILGIPAEAKAAWRARVLRMGTAVGCFAFGCGSAALLFVLLGMGCFLLPPVIALLGILFYSVELVAKPS
jgi:uncharacterized membrane protein YoaK (UPF0700 family)